MRAVSYRTNSNTFDLDPCHPKQKRKVLHSGLTSNYLDCEEISEMIFPWEPLL